MIAIFSDTHSTGGHELTGDALEAARRAETVVHAGDFTSTATLEAFQRECPRLFAVHGNADSAAVRNRLPTARVVEADGVRIALTHRREGGATGLAMFGRSRDADVVVSGHTHRPTVVETDDVVLINPGSHAQPRGNRAGFAVLERSNGTLEGELRTPNGGVAETFTVATRE